MCVFMTVLGKCCKGKELLYRSMKVEQRANAACVWSKKIQDTGIKCDNVSWSVFADILHSYVIWVWLCTFQVFQTK